MLGKKKETGQKEAFFSLYRGAGKPLKHLEPALGRIEKREEKKKRRQNLGGGGVLGLIS